MLVGSHVFDVEQIVPYLISSFADLQSFAYHTYGQVFQRNPRQDILQTMMSDQEVLLYGSLRCQDYRVVPILNHQAFAVRFCDYIIASTIPATRDGKSPNTDSWGRRCTCKQGPGAQVTKLACVDYKIIISIRVGRFSAALHLSLSRF